MNDIPRAQLLALIERMRADDESAWHPLCMLVLRRAALPVARKYFPGDEDAVQTIAAHVIAQLGTAVRSFDPEKVPGGDGCQLFRRWAYTKAMDLFSRPSKLPAVVRRLMQAPDGGQHSYFEALYRRCVLRGDASHVVIAELVLRSSGQLTEATLEAALLKLERALVSARVARRLEREEMDRAAPLHLVGQSHGRPSPDAHDEALGWLIARALVEAVEALPPRLKCVVHGRRDERSWARIERDCSCSVHIAKKDWSTASRRLKRTLEERFGSDVMRLVAEDGFVGVGTYAA